MEVAGVFEIVAQGLKGFEAFETGLARVHAGVAHYGEGGAADGEGGVGEIAARRLTQDAGRGVIVVGGQIEGDTTAVGGHWGCREERLLTKADAREIAVVSCLLKLYLYGYAISRRW